MIRKITTNKWFWIGIVIFGVLAYVAVRGWSDISEYKKQAQELKQANDKLKENAKAKESQFSTQMGNLGQKTAEMSKQLIILQQKNEALVQRNTELVKQGFELEKRYAEIVRREKQITVPAGRPDRVKLLNFLGY